MRCIIEFEDLKHKTCLARCPASNIDGMEINRIQQTVINKNKTWTVIDVRQVCLNMRGTYNMYHFYDSLTYFERTPTNIIFS